MAKALFIAFRNPRHQPVTEDHFRRLAKALAPDHIVPREPWIMADEQDLAVIFQPTPSALRREEGICLGHMLYPHPEWWILGSDPPDGSFAIIRRDERAVELVSDVLASRSLWYALTPEMFIASTSLRALQACLRSYEPNPAAKAWMLSAGNIGWGQAWDRRVSFVPPASRVTLDRASWTLTQHSEPCVFDPDNRPADELQCDFAAALHQTVQRVQDDLTDWRLLLTGGYDSRLLLLMGLKEHRVKTLTWGLSGDTKVKYSDVWVADLLAKRFRLDHEFYATDRMIEDPLDAILNRFIIQCEGRVDNFTGYLDGLRIYKYFYDSEVPGIIRGEAAIGYHSVEREFDARRLVEMLMLTDYSNLDESWTRHYARQEIPAPLNRRGGESLFAWRDRIYQEYTIPVRFGALNELKCWYVEIINPIITRSVLNVSRRVPDHLRTGRPLYENIVRDLCPDIPFARDLSTASRKADLLRTEPYVRIMTDTLDCDDARSLLSDELVDTLLSRMVTRDGEHMARKRLRKKIFRFVPKRLKKLIRNSVAPPSDLLTMDYNILAFRAYMVVRADQLMRSDAQLLV